MISVYMVSQLVEQRKLQVIWLSSDVIVVATSRRTLQWDMNGNPITDDAGITGIAVLIYVFKITVVSYIYM